MANSSSRKNGRHPGLKQRRFRQRLSAYRESRAGRAPRRIPRAAVPSFFTLMNLFCGFLAIVQVHDGQFVTAGWLIVLAGFFDALDGMMARLTNGQSLFGVELDSLSDIVSFGVAPAFLMYVYALNGHGTAGLIVASLPAMCGAVRLARFNVSFDGEKKEYFTGLPIPMSAAVFVAVILNAESLAFLSPDAESHRVLLTTVIVISGLMISNVRFDTLPKPSAASFRQNPAKGFLSVAAILMLIFFREMGLLVVLVVYLLLGMGRGLYSFGRSVWVAESSTEADA
jgi:CDP-diacylglycerol--serine O-phosphatidyltransferase